jgi:hypothetical protein
VVSIKYITTTLHQAIDAYSLRLKNTGKTDEDGNLVARVNKCRDRLRYLKQAHKDLPLWRLDLTQLSENHCSLEKPSQNAEGQMLCESAVQEALRGYEGTARSFSSDAGCTEGSELVSVSGFKSY